VTISRIAYPNRLTHETAIDRFSCLSSSIFPRQADNFNTEKGTESDSSSSMKSVLENLMNELNGKYLVKNDDAEKLVPYAIGVSRVYFKPGVLETFEVQRIERLGVYATSIERIVRGFVAKSIFRRLRSTEIDIQALVRMNFAMRELSNVCHAVTSLSCWIRCIFAKRELIKLKKEKAATLIQTRIRIMQATNILKKCKGAATQIQKIVRGACQKKNYLVMLEEAKEEARVNTKLVVLQKRLVDVEMKWIKADKAHIEAEKKLSAGDTNIPNMNVKSSTTTSSLQVAAGNEEKKDDDDRNNLLDASNEMINYLKKQVFELRGKNFLMRSDVSSLKEANHHLTEQLGSMTASFEAFKQHASQLSQKNKTLTVQASTRMKELANIKKESISKKFKSMQEIGKLKDLMSAKDMDNARTIAQLKEENEIRLEHLMHFYFGSQ